MVRTGHRAATRTEASACEAAPPSAAAAFVDISSELAPPPVVPPEMAETPLWRRNFGMRPPTADAASDTAPQPSAAAAPDGSASGAACSPSVEPPDREPTTAAAPPSTPPMVAKAEKPPRRVAKGRPLGSIDLDEGAEAPPISEQIQAALRANAGRVIDLFRSWDADGDGVVTRPEFHRAMTELGLEVPRLAVDDLFSQWDRDGGGTLALRELSKILRAPPGSSGSKAAAPAFEGTVGAPTAPLPAPTAAPAPVPMPPCEGSAQPSAEARHASPPLPDAAPEAQLPPPQEQGLAAAPSSAQAAEQGLALPLARAPDPPASSAVAHAPPATNDGPSATDCPGDGSLTADEAPLPLTECSAAVRIQASARRREVGRRAIWRAAAAVRVQAVARGQHARRCASAEREALRRAALAGATGREGTRAVSDAAPGAAVSDACQANGGTADRAISMADHALASGLPASMPMPQPPQPQPPQPQPPQPQPLRPSVLARATVHMLRRLLQRCTNPCSPP